MASLSEVLRSVGSLHSKVDGMKDQLKTLNGSVAKNTTDVAVLDATVMTASACTERQEDFATVIVERVLDKANARNVTLWQRFGATVLSGVVVAILVAVILQVIGA